MSKKYISYRAVKIYMYPYPRLNDSIIAIFFTFGYDFQKYLCKLKNKM